MNILPKSIQNAIEALSDLPGIGTRSAERLVFSLLKNETDLAQKIGRNLVDLRDSVKECSICGNYCEKSAEKCVICSKTRDLKLLCIVESPVDLLAIEKTHEFKGYYHVLHGVLSPMNRITPEKLNIASLFDRDLDTIEEIILATSGSVESEATAMYLSDQLHQKFRGKITRLARGIPSGGDLDYLDAGTLTRALTERRDF